MSCPDCEGVGGHDCERYGLAPDQPRTLDETVSRHINQSIADALAASLDFDQSSDKVGGR